MTRKKLKSKKLIIVIICVLVAVVAVAVYVGPKLLSSDKDTASKVQNTPENDSDTSESSDSPEYVTDDGGTISDVELVEMGEYMEFASQKMKVNSAKLVDSISDGSSYSSPAVAGDGAKFLVVNITIENTSVSPFAYRDFSLFTSNDSVIEKQYGAYSSYGEIENYIDGRELQPGIPETGNVVYRVPNGKNEFLIGGAISGTSRALHTKISL